MQINTHTVLTSIPNSRFSKNSTISTPASSFSVAKIRVTHSHGGSIIIKNNTNNIITSTQRWQRLAYSSRWRTDHATLHDSAWPATFHSVYCAVRAGVAAGAGSRKPFMRPIYRTHPAGSDGSDHEPAIGTDKNQLPPSPPSSSTSQEQPPPSPPRTPLLQPTNSILYKIETIIERTIFNCRFVTLFAVVGSLSGSLLCFVQGCHFVKSSFLEYFRATLRGLDTSHIILSLVEAIDLFLVGTVMLIFGMGLYELFVNTIGFRKDKYLARKGSIGSNLFGLFRIQERPLWLEIKSLDDLKTKIGHVVVMILLVGMFEKSKIVPINTGQDFLCFSGSIMMAASCLYCLSKLNVGK